MGDGRGSQSGESETRRMKAWAGDDRNGAAAMAVIAQRALEAIDHKT
jgi:hypothetical protein